jgi:phospholipid/cholesterol/gamma-HCH transport system ATP-binding protein
VASHDEQPAGRKGNGENDSPVVEMEHITTRFGAQVVHDDISFDVRAGEILALVGGSGSGKTTLLREALRLMKPTEGTIRVFGVDLGTATEEEAVAVKRRIGVLFQKGGLFGALTLLENVGLPLREHTDLRPEMIDQVARLKIGFVGLPPDAEAKFPSQLSGGMIKRAGLARALALDPELLVLDEPTSGLDPVGARALDRLILDLHQALQLTVLLVTHDLDSIRILADRVAMLGKGRLLALGTVEELERSEVKEVREYFEAGDASAVAQTARAADERKRG